MSRHHFNTQLGDKPVQLVIGWDRPMKQYFFNVHDLSPNADDDVIASSMDMDQQDLYDVDGIVEKLKELGITPPQKMVDEVQADEVNSIGNRMEFYN
jgi:alcohol dehydrogenase YqhD (iron-dependent ADH family)